MKTRADSASRRSCSAVEPARSAKTIVTTLRAPAASATPAPNAASATGAAHSSQNFAVGRSSEPQPEHNRLSGAAHCSQNFAPGRFSCPQAPQFIGSPRRHSAVAQPPACAGSARVSSSSPHSSPAWRRAALRCASISESKTPRPRCIISSERLGWIRRTPASNSLLSSGLQASSGWTCVVNLIS